MKTPRRASDSHRAIWAPVPYEWDRIESLRNHLTRNNFINKTTRTKPHSREFYETTFKNVGGRYDWNPASALPPIRAALKRGDCVAATRGVNIMADRAAKYVDEGSALTQRDRHVQMARLLRGISSKVLKVCSRKRSRS